MAKTFQFDNYQRNANIYFFKSIFQGKIYNKFQLFFAKCTEYSNQTIIFFFRNKLPLLHFQFKLSDQKLFLKRVFSSTGKMKDVTFRRIKKLYLNDFISMKKITHPNLFQIRWK